MQPRTRTDLVRAVTVGVAVAVAVGVDRAVAAGRPAAVVVVVGVDRIPAPPVEVPDRRGVVQDPLALDRVRGPVLPDPGLRPGPGAEVPRQIQISRVVVHLSFCINKDDLILESIMGLLSINPKMSSGTLVPDHSRTY